MPGPDRPAALQNFIDATLGVMTAFAIVPEAQRALEGIRPAASRVAPPSGRKPGHQPACRHLEAGLAQSAADPRLAPLVAAFRAAEPLLEWTTDPPSGDSPEGDPENYAEITIFGPGGYPCDPRRRVLRHALIQPHGATLRGRSALPLCPTALRHDSRVRSTLRHTQLQIPPYSLRLSARGDISSLRSSGHTCRSCVGRAPVAGRKSSVGNTRTSPPGGWRPRESDA